MENKNGNKMMWNKIIKTFDMKSNDNEDTTRRKFPRRAMDTCAISVNGVTHPIKDWSQTGALFQGDGRGMNEGQIIDVKMKFRMTDQIIEVPLEARIVRAGASQIAVEFFNINLETKRAFNKVIDDALTREFVDTQAL